MAFNKPKAHERAERYAAKGQHDRAAREYQAIVEHDPKDIRAWLMLADCLERCGDRPGAIERYVRVAQYYVDEKELPKALAVYQQVLNLDRRRADIQGKVAALHLRMGHVPDAIAIYERIAAAQLHAGRVADALATYKLVADAEPAAVPRRLRLAELYSREKRNAEAVEAFRQAGDELRKVGRLADFVRVAERLLYHDGSDLPTIRALAQAYLGLGDPRRALMKLNGLLRANPKDEEGIELLAETFMAMGKPEKALSALEELVRSLRARGPEARDDAVRVVRRGLEWRPGHAEFREALTELEGRRRAGAAAPEPAGEIEQELDLDDSDVVELDDDDLVMEEEVEEPVSPAPNEVPRVGAEVDEPSEPVALPKTASLPPGTRRPTTEVEALPSVEPSLTQSVLSEVSGEGPPPDLEELTDFDKILFEARVYIKYRLFEHALEHVRAALQQQPRHVGALSLQARAFTELERSDDAAEVHLRVAELVASRDPKLAREHLSAARSLVPNNPRIQALAEGLTEPAAPRPALDEDGDSGAVDLVSGDLQDLVTTPPASRVDVSEEPAANLIAAQEEDGESTQPFTPIDPRTGDVPAPARRPRGTPPAGFVPRPPEGAGGPTREPGPSVELPLNDDLTPEPVSVEPVPGQPAEEPAPARTGRTIMPFVQPEFSSTGLGAVEFEDDGLVDGRGVLGDDDPELEVPTVPTEVIDPAAVEADGIPAAVPVPPSGGWPDLSDDLAEIRFYVDQGLDDDAEAALSDLDERYPGHPELAAFRGEAGGAESAAVMVEAEAAEPLVSFEEPSAASEPLLSFDEDEDEDAYLSAIFADPGERREEPKPATSAGAGAHLAEGQSVDAATAYDLGVAYREMGLVDAAITQFETAAFDPQWQARALVMLGTLRVHRGETNQAIADLQQAVSLAATQDESSEAAYELGVLYEMLGDVNAAIMQLQSVAAGYRDRDERLAQLIG